MPIYCQGFEFACSLSDAATGTIASPTMGTTK